MIYFEEKPNGDGAWINGGFFVCNKKVLDYIDNDSTDNTDGYWAVWGSNFLGFSVPRPDLNPSGLNGITNNLQISGKGTIGTPQTTVLTQHRLDNAGFIPIDIKGISTQGYNYLKGKAQRRKRDIACI